MVSVNVLRILVLLVIVQVVISVAKHKKKKDKYRVERPKIQDYQIRHRNIEKKKTHKEDRSTSSSSGTPKKGKGSDDSGSSDSLREDISEESSSSESRKDRPKSSAERKGWRKWHRKCDPCPEDMKLKWRDPGINWICGSYQNARRSFKSLCMMHYRNCQDGTMFIKIHDHKCEDDITRPRRHGEHFFYDYKVVLSEDSTEESSNLSSKDSESDTS